MHMNSDCINFEHTMIFDNFIWATIKKTDFVTNFSSNNWWLRNLKLNQISYV